MVEEEGGSGTTGLGGEDSGEAVGEGVGDCSDEGVGRGRGSWLRWKKEGSLNRPSKG